MNRLLRLRLRLRESWLWWRHTWWFQWAHSPLCARFHRDALHLGPVHLCRSCTLLYLAFVLTITAVVAFRPATELVLASAYGLLVPLLALSNPWLYRRLPRGVRDVVRFGSGAALGLLMILLLGAFWWLAAATFLVGAAFFLVYRRARGRVKLTECEGCPELGRDCVCSGYSRQADAIRLFRDRMEEELNRPHVVSLLVRSKAERCGRE